MNPDPDRIDRKPAGGAGARSMRTPVHADAFGFAVGCIFTFLACVVTAFQTGTTFGWMVCYALGVLTAFRILVVGLSGGTSRIDQDVWSRIYADSGLVHVFLIGLWPLAIFAGPEDTAAQLFSFGAAICFLVGLVARNFGSAVLVRRQLLLAAIPMVTALLIPAEIFHAAFAMFFAVFCVTLLRISDRMRETFEKALVGAEENRRLAHSDTLTGLDNRFAMTRRIEAAIDEGDRPFAVHFIDLDRFKRLNDSYGHGFGDRVLVETAARVSAFIGEGATLSRFAGDEFVLLDERFVSREEAGRTAAALIAAVGKPMSIDGVSLTVACSVGIAIYPLDARTFSQIIQRADTALYAAKAAGRAQHVFFDAAMDERERVRVRVETDLRAAIAADDLYLVYQPIIDSATHRIASCEALLRWNHPTSGALSPGVFLPIAEECGMMKAVTDLTLRKACAAAAQWPGGVGVAVNLSPSQLDRSDIVETILEAAHQAGLPRHRLEIEITENLFLDQDRGVLDKLARLHAAGIRFSLDDFGTGYSNLGYISRLPLEKIKIDRSFVVRAALEASDRALLRGLIRLIHSLDLKIVVEGIETDAQLRMVMEEERVEELQGFVFGQPLPREAIGDLLALMGSADGSSCPDGGERITDRCR